MKSAPEPVFHDYVTVLEYAILELRMRLRYEDDVTLDEIHDMLDAIHNIPTMLRQFGDWHVPDNIDADLERYDAKWLGIGSAELRLGLLKHLERARAGDYDNP